MHRESRTNRTYPLSPKTEIKRDPLSDVFSNTEVAEEDPFLQLYYYTVEINDDPSSCYFKLGADEKEIIDAYESQKDPYAPPTPPPPAPESAVLLESSDDPIQLGLLDGEIPRKIRKVYDLSNDICISTTAFFTVDDLLNATCLHRITYESQKDPKVQRGTRDTGKISFSI